MGVFGLSSVSFPSPPPERLPPQSIGLTKAKFQALDISLGSGELHSVVPR